MTISKIGVWAVRVVVYGSLVMVFATQAQALRDPTVPPTQSPASPGAQGSPAQSPLGEEGTSVIVRDGKPGLVQGTRIVFPGQKWGRWTLERITETEVWLRDGATLRKMQRFTGIRRTDSALAAVACAAQAAASAPAKKHKKTKALLTSTPADTRCDAPPTRSSNP